MTQIRFIFFLTALFVITNYALAIESKKFSSWEDACASAEKVVAEGDLIFLDMPDYLSKRESESMHSWTSHVGMTFRDQKNQMIVSESTIPFSRDISLCDFLKTSTEFRFQIRRLNRSLEKNEISKMRATVLPQLGRFYDLRFDFDSNKPFCSKFVYQAYKAIGVEVGQIQTFRQLFEVDPKTSYTFWKFWFFGFIPWERHTITPASQLNDSKFLTVLDGF